MCKNKKIILCRAPIRLDLGGGPSDVQPFPQFEDGFVINTTINLYARAKLEINDKNKNIVLHSKDYKTIDKFDDIDSLNLSEDSSLIKSVIGFIKPDFGFKLTTEVDVPPGSGLGSSAALVVSILCVFFYYKSGKYYDSRKLARDALYIENRLLNNICGGQDQYATALGGFNTFRFKKNKIQIKKLCISPKNIKKMEESSLLCFSGTSHISGLVLKKVMQNFKLKKIGTVTSLINIRNVAIKTAEILHKGFLDDFGPLLTKTFENQKKLHTSITTPNINKIFSIALNYGVSGGKIAGAGGGGFVYLYCEKGLRNKIQTALRQAGYGVYKIKFVKKGPVVSYIFK